jgi:formylmethanofuran dehydrogenase subunit E
MSETRVDVWTCERCAREERVIRCDPEWRCGENISVDGEWVWLDGSFVCPHCLTQAEREAQP